MTVEAAAEIPDPNALAPQAEPATPPVETPQDSPEAPEQAHGNKGRQPWYMDRIAQNQRKADEARAEADAALRRAQTAEEMLARATTQDPAARAPAAARAQSDPQEFQNAVRQQAQADRFMEDVNRVRNEGFAKFPNEFAHAIDAAGAVGLGRPDVLADLFAVDPVNAHEILYALTREDNLERAAALAEMDPRRRIAEFTRMSDAAKKGATVTTTTTTPAKVVSKAPAPAPRIEPSTTRTVDWRADETDDATFNAGFDEMMAKRRARR